MDLSAFLKAIPAAASSPLALAAYLLTLLASVLLGLRITRNKNVMQGLDKFPEEDRKKVILAEMNSLVPDNISAEEWVRIKIRQIYLTAFLILIMCGTAICIIALSRSPDASVAPHLIVNGRGPVFQPPKLNSRTVDSCIVSPMFPSPMNLQCVHSAEQIIANAFCKEAGYTDAKIYTTAFIREMQNSLKLERNISPDGKIFQQWTEDNTGGAIFSSITCEIIVPPVVRIY